ncbi:Uncharacterised protein [Mycobacteroides abscessus subsp. abscessus]|nr:Uncharacterised protein [Mycobacteroides abscessus subsp. abscessus]
MRVIIGTIFEPHLFEEAQRFFPRFLFRALQDDHLAFHYIFSRGQMREEIIILEYHAGLLAEGYHFRRFNFRRIPELERFVSKLDLTGIRSFEQIHASEKCCLPGS